MDPFQKINLLAPEYAKVLRSAAFSMVIKWYRRDCEGRLEIGQHAIDPGRIHFD
jgi:hypothetical protein